MGEQRRSFPREFKLEAVRLATTSGRRLSEVARELGVRPDALWRWKRQAERQGSAARAGAQVFPGSGKLTSQDEELRRLKRELEVVRQERDFLKRATVFFAKESR